MIELLFFFGAGLLLAFTPCVLPTIPIVAKLLKRNNNYDLLLYVVTCATVYGILGTVVGVGGYFLQPYFQSPVVLLSSAVVLIVLALIEFEVFRFPYWNLTDYFSQYKLGPVLWAIFSVLIMSPCTTPALAAILGYMSTGGSIYYGFVELFVLGLGINTPLILIGYFGKTFLIDRGLKYMKFTNLVIGILMLTMAGGLILRTIPALSESYHHTDFRSGAVLTVYTASWCGICHEFVNNEVPKIRAAGIQVNLVDVSNGGLPRGFSGVPAMILTKNGKVVHRGMGYVSASTIIKEAR